MKTQRVILAVAIGAIATVVGFYGINFWQQKQRINHLLTTGQCLDCNLRGANLERLDLTNANLEGANLEKANLQGSKLGSTNLQRANLQGANLKGADFGCNAFSFSVESDSNNSNLGFRVDRSPTPSPSSDMPLGFNLNTTDQRATLSFNLGGCPILTGADLQGTIMPDGSIHP
jgi:uncharacterized protein YjbI with pentapeptide repeats